MRDAHLILGLMSTSLFVSLRLEKTGLSPMTPVASATSPKENI